MSNKIKLFNESDQEEAEPVEFRTNRSYAKHYDEFRKKEILGQLKNLDPQESSDSSDDETTDEEVVDADFDKEFFRTLAFLKRNDPNKYAEQPKFFENVKPVEEVALVKRHRKEKPMTLKDYERKIILEKGGVYEDEDDIAPTSDRIQWRAESPTLVEEEQKIKDDIRKALSKIDDSDSDGDGKADTGDRGGGLLKERAKSKVDHEKEQADYIQWLADKKAKEPPTEEVKDLQPLKHYWSNAKLSKEDAFLKDYILNKRFVGGGDVPSYDDIVATSEDEEELEKQEEFERKYNFRFEEPDPEFIKRYPRTTEDSVRIERNKRKEQRQALKERKQAEKEQQRRQLDELKAIKLQEIKERIQRLKEIAAMDKLALNEEDLESDFDADEHDRRMQQMFNDEYYGVDEGDQKPEFPELDEELGIENYDKDIVDDDAEADAGGPYCEDDDFVMDCDYEAKVKEGQSSKETFQQELLDSTRSRKKNGRKQSKFREVLKAEKPLFDPEDEKTYGEYIDEYYKLDYEDMIGDTPCRFKYVETVPNDFGLSVEEILAANTRELNRWASVKKTVQLRPKQVELKEIDAYRRKGENEALKRKLLPSLFIETDANEEEDAEIKERKQGLQAADPKSGDEKNKAATSKETKQQKKKKKLKEKVSFTETDNTGEEPVQEKKAKKPQPSIDPKPEEESSPTEAPDTPVDRRSSEHQTNGRKNGPTGAGPGHDRKRSWNQMNGTASSGQKNAARGGPEKPERFGKNRRPYGQHGGARPNGNARGPKHSNRVESASDQRLRAFGLNPKKFHNFKKYGNQQNTGTGENKIIKFE